MRRARMITLVALTATALVIVLQNTDPVETDILFFTITMPRAILLLGTALIGFVVGVLVALALIRKRQ